MYRNLMCSVFDIYLLTCISCNFSSMWLITILLYILCVSYTSCFINMHQQIKREKLIEDRGAPLILTPLIKANKIKEAQAASEVKFSGFKHVRSYAGYLTVNEQFNSNLFFWFFPSATDYANSPVLLWLQGGPGATSLMGLFTENGPFSVRPKHGLKLRKYAWTANHSVIYIDNPAGVGYSFTNDGGWPRNETAIGNELYKALVQFFLLFPELQTNGFFVTGESYAGKYVPAVAYAIYQNNGSGKLKINLKGLAIGNGLCDPENQFQHAGYLYQLGLVDTRGKEKIEQLEGQMIKYIRNKQWLEANGVSNEMFINSSTYGTTVFQNVTGFKNYFNYLYSGDTSENINYMYKYMQRQDIRAAVHVGNTTFNTKNQQVIKSLAEDSMQPITPWISELLSHYRILFYNGQLDIILPYFSTVNFLQKLNFSSADEYKKAERHPWYLNGDIAGYVKQAGNLTEILVRNAGHMVPQDQPKWAFDLIKRFTRNKPFFLIKIVLSLIRCLSYIP